MYLNHMMNKFKKAESGMLLRNLIKENDTKYVTILAIEALRNSNKIYNGL